jgi:hypothetical protein
MDPVVFAIAEWQVKAADTNRIGIIDIAKLWLFLCNRVVILLVNESIAPVMASHFKRRAGCQR